MPAKNVVAKAWSLQPSFDGFRYSTYPNGDKPAGYQTAPTLIGIDKPAGSLTGNEYGKGAYLWLFGYGLGTRANVGTAAGARVYMRDPLGDNTWHEVDNYRCLRKSVSYTRTQVMVLVVQVGSLGGSMVNGRALDVKITVNGVDTNILTGAFTIQPGDFYFFSPTGNDSTGVKNDITKPFRYLQQANGGTSFTGIWATFQPGDTAIGRAGDYSDATGFEGKWLRLQAHTGSTPTGVVGHGYYNIEPYPGPILGNAVEDVHYSVPASGAGGIHGCSSTRASQGYGKFLRVVGLRMDVHATAASDAAPINLQAGANNWGIHECDLGPWLSTLVSPNNAKAGGIAGCGDTVQIRFNYIHDIDCDANNPGTSALENHGVYVGDANGVCSKNWDIGYNWIKNIPGGSLLQFNDTAASDTFSGMKVHHNFMEVCRKYAINFGNQVLSCDIWNNVLLFPKRNIWRIANSVASAAVRFSHNTCCQNYSDNAYASMLANETAGLTSGSYTFEHNIFAIGAMSGSLGPNGLTFSGFGAGDTAVTVSRNLYFDYNSITTSAPTRDATGAYGNPLFTDYVNGDVTVQTGSPALGAATQAETQAVTDDFWGIARPVTGTGAPGATKNDLGAGQGVGT